MWSLPPAGGLRLRSHGKLRRLRCRPVTVVAWQTTPTAVGLDACQIKPCPLILHEPSDPRGRAAALHKNSAKPGGNATNRNTLPCCQPIAIDPNGLFVVSPKWVIPCDCGRPATAVAWQTR